MLVCNVKVTVAMPAFNASEYILEAIESVLAQNFDAFELIIFNDGSTDDTWGKLSAYSNHPKLQLHNSPLNIGSGKIRNRILEIARGEYFLPCDADDLLLPGALKTLSRFLNSHLDIGVVYADILRIETDDNHVQNMPSILGRDCNLVWDLHENAVNHGGSMIRTELARKVGGYAIGGMPDDWGLFIKLVEITKIHYLSGNVFYVWRLNSGSQSRLAQNHEGIDMMIKEAIKRRQSRFH